jgi:regulator of sirC expression with transglutaminase-like and TPR domain
METWSLRDELGQEPLNVPRLALLVARRVAYPTLNMTAYMDRLYALADGAARMVPSHARPHEQAQKLATYLFLELGFRGNDNDYGDPRNSFLNEVLERRLGIPITLSIIYVFVAQQLHIPAYGVGLPGHFIVGVEDREAEYWFDPYHGGRELSLADCAFLVRATIGHEGPLEAAWFAPAAPRHIIARLLNNLRINYVRRQRWAETITVIEQLRLIQPDEAEHVRDLGLAHYRQRSLHQAAHYLNHYLQIAPQASDAAAIRDGVRDILNEWARQN